MNRKHFAMKVAVMALAGMMVASPAWAEKKGKAADKSGPSMEETIEFVRNKLVGCNDFLSSSGFTTAEGHEGAIVNRYSWADISLQNTELSAIQSVQKQDSLFNSRNGKIWNRVDEAYRAVVKISLADLSPVLTTHHEGGSTLVFSVKVNCTSGACIQWTKNRLMDPDGKHGFTSFIPSGEAITQPRVNSWNFEVCGGQEDADRIAKAMSHAISLAGGKKSLF